MTTLPFRRAFITGGAGFIGSHLADALLARGVEVTAYDNLSKGYPDDRRIRHLYGHPRFRFVRGDLLDTQRLASALEGHDIVWHLAAESRIPMQGVDPWDHLRDNILATFHLLEAVRQVGIRQFVYSSASTVYGEPRVIPTPEDAGPLLPISIYGATKLGCEGLVSAYAHLYGIQSWMFRFGNVVGSRMDHGVILDFIRKLRRNPHELEVLGNGEQEKNFFLVEDCIEGMLCAVTRARDRACEVFNLGNESTTRISEVARIVIEEMGLKGVRIRYTGGDRGWPGDVPRVIFDLTKIHRLGWRASCSSTEAVRLTARRLLEDPVPWLDATPS